MTIKNAEAHALAREIAERSGLSLTEAVLAALREKRAVLGANHMPREAQAKALLGYGSRLRRVRTGASSDTDGLYDDIWGGCHARRKHLNSIRSPRRYSGTC